MATLTIKNVPDKLYQKLKKAATENRRSINSEAIVCLERVLQPQRLSVDEVLERARKLREFTAEYTLTDDEIIRMKNQGRR